jgi:hypothetical protein
LGHDGGDVFDRVLAVELVDGQLTQDVRGLFFATTL